MKKALRSAIAVFSILTCRVAYATQASSSSLGPAAMFSSDEGGAWLYPAEINNCPKALSFETDSTSYKKDNMTFLGFWSDQERRFGTFGIGYGDMFHQKNIEAVILALNTAIASNPLMSPHNDIPLPANNYHLFYARDIGPLICGLHFSRNTGRKNYDFSDTIPEDTVKRRADFGSWSVEAGASAIIGDNIYVQSVLGYQAISFLSRFELSGASPLYWEEITDKDANGARLSLRLFYGINDQIKIVPVISYNVFSLGYSAGYGDTLHTPGSLYYGTGGRYSQMAFKGAIGAEYRPQKNIKLLGGVSMEYAGVDISDSSNVWLKTTNPSQRYLSQEKRSTLLPGIQGGFEAGLLKWLKLRLGASQLPATAIIKSEFKNGLTIETSENDSEFNIYFGLGFAFGRLTIDAQLNEDQPYNLGYLISGISEIPFARLSMKYNF